MSLKKDCLIYYILNETEKFSIIDIPIEDKAKRMKVYLSDGLGFEIYVKNIV